MSEEHSPYHELSSFQQLIQATMLLDEPSSSEETPSQTQKLYNVNDSGNIPQLRTLPRFLSSLWVMLNDNSNKWINWSGVNAFTISSKEDLSREVLPKFFKHNRFSSFTRQLHAYQFVKIKDSKDSNSLKWKHVHLNRKQYQSLFKIRRTLCSKSMKQKFTKDELLKILEDQHQKILILQTRMDVLEDEVKKNHDARESMEQGLLTVKRILRQLNFAYRNNNFAETQFLASRQRFF